MAGHSKWANIKRKKAAQDAKKAKVYTKLLREIQVAAKLGGSNPDNNVRLKTAIQTAKSMSVPSDNIERAAKRGAGETDGAEYEEIMYEGYGPSGVAVMVKALTDNKNRTASEVRHAFSRANGNLGTTNSVSFQFEERGVLTLAKEAAAEDVLLDLALDSGAQDVRDEGDVWEVQTSPRDFDRVRTALEALKVEIEGEVRFVPLSTVKVVGDDAASVLKLLDALDDLDDVQSVFSNADIDDATMEAASK